MLLLKLRLFLPILFGLLLLQGCLHDDDSDPDGVIQISRLIPAMIGDTNLPDNGSLKVSAYHAGQLLGSQSISDEQVEGELRLAMSPGKYQITVVFEFESAAYGTVSLASIQADEIELPSGQTVTVEFAANEFVYANDDGDLYTNLVELGYGTDPGIDNHFFFVTADDGVSGLELYVTDGTSDFMKLVKDINSNSDSNPAEYVVIDDFLYFTATDQVVGVELWRVNLQTKHVELVKDIYSGSSGSIPQNLTAVGDTLYFSAYTEANGRELWKSNGTEAGTLW